MADIVREGLQYILEAAFSEVQTPPANFYIGLATDAAIAETANLAALTEITGTGYARIAVASSAVGFPTSETTGTNDWHVVTLQVTFTGNAANDWDEAFSAFLATTSDDSGKLIAWCALSAGRDLTSASDTLKVTFDLTLTG